MNSLIHNRAFHLSLVALVVRLLFLIIFAGPNYFEGISNGYIEVARNILEGRGAVVHVDLAPLTASLPQWSYEPFIDRPLGYVLLILLPLFFSSSAIAIQLLHALLAAASTVMLYHLASTMFSNRVAYRSAFLYAVWPLSARFEIAILPDAVMSFFLLITLLLFIKAPRSRYPLAWYAGSGFLCGIGVTMRPDILFLPLFFVAWLLLTNVSGSRRLRYSFIFLLGTGLVIGAQTVRNYAATSGTIVPLGLGNGISLWEGISQFGDTLGTVYGDERVIQREGFHNWAYPNGIERDRLRFQEAVKIIRNHPSWYAGVMLKRIPVLLTPDWIMSRRFTQSLKEFLDSSSQHTVSQYAVTFPLAFALRVCLILLQYVSLILAGVALWTKRRDFLAYLPALIVFYYIVVHIPTNSEARYFYPAIPFVLLLASQGWEWMKQRTHPV